MMSDYEKLEEKLKNTPFLVIDANGKVKLTDEAEVTKLVLAQSGSVLVQNLERALEGFSRLKGVGKADRTFTRDDLAKICGITRQGVWLLQTKEVLIPSIRRSKSPKEGASVYSWSDAFVAGVIGSVRRHGLDRYVLKKLQPLLVTSKTNKKRTGKKLATSPRS